MGKDIDEVIKENAENYTEKNMEDKLGENTKEYVEENMKDKSKFLSEEVQKDDKSTYIKKEIFSWVRVVLGAFIVALILSKFVIVNAKVPTGSMISTIEKGDKLIGFRLSYLFSDPKRGDIVMFDAPDKKDTIYIKRLIGLPGDEIKISNNQLYINGELQVEDYVKNGWTNSPGTEVYTVPKGQYFMMGDNRDGSSDSRVWGFVKRDAIIAKGIFRYSPSIGMLE